MESLTPNILALTPKKRRLCVNWRCNIILLTHSQELTGVNSQRNALKFYTVRVKSTSSQTITDATFLVSINIAVWKVQKSAHSGQNIENSVKFSPPRPYIVRRNCYFFNLFMASRLLYFSENVLGGVRLVSSIIWLNRSTERQKD